MQLLEGPSVEEKWKKMKDFKSSALSWIRTLGWWFKHFLKLCYNCCFAPTLINSSVSFSDWRCSSRCRFLVLVVHSKQQFITTGLSEIWGFETKRAAKCLCYCFDVWTGERKKRKRVVDSRLSWPRGKNRLGGPFFLQATRSRVHIPSIIDPIGVNVFGRVTIKKVYPSIVVLLYFQSIIKTLWGKLTLRLSGMIYFWGCRGSMLPVLMKIYLTKSYLK